MATGPKQVIRAIGRSLLWPLRRFFDPRFAGLGEIADEKTHAVLVRFDSSEASIRDEIAQRDPAIAELQSLIVADMDAGREAATVFGQTLTDLLGMTEEIRERTERVVEEIRERAERAQHARRAAASPSQLEAADASLLDHETTSQGFAAHAGLFFNPPIWVGYEPGRVFVRGVNERIVEIPYVLRALAPFNEGSSILDVGATESTLALSLASLGYRVTAVDPRPYPIEHPSLDPVVAVVEEWSPGRTFNAAVCVSTIEHIGLGAYGEPAHEGRRDLAALARLRDLVEPDGLLVLTTRFGEPGQDAFQRTYDSHGLEELLAGWDVLDLSFAERVDERTWLATDSTKPQASESVALITARRPT
jgi:2-polyprenyl-3-methyl-5-hydroxy-6-metoxy-1,4-benzoquinol methylase